MTEHLTYYFYFPVFRCFHMNINKNGKMKGVGADDEVLLTQKYFDTSNLS